VTTNASLKTCLVLSYGIDWLDGVFLFQNFVMFANDSELACVGPKIKLAAGAFGLLN
jgi:hypothetical protein